MSEQGSILITALVIISSMTLLGMFIADHLLIQQKINHNLYIEMKIYYLAQAGIEEAIYRLRQNRFWWTSNRVVLLGDGKYRLIVANDGSKITVQSYGCYGEYEYCQVAYFSLTEPVIRIK